MEIIQFITDALGDASYLVIAGKQAAAIDPQRDVRPLLQAAEERGATIAYVFETHVHNDYVSGGRELAELGAKVVAPSGCGLEFPHVELADGEEIAIGPAVLRAFAAPGHTFEHNAYIALDEARETRGVFTGGSLLMAAAGRSDLLGPQHTEQLTRLQWESAQRLRQVIPSEAEIYPTHGAGSFCSSAGADAGRHGPLSIEIQRNPLYVPPGFESFRSAHLASLAPIPGYYRFMAPINRHGPPVYGEPPLPVRITPAEAVSLLKDGALLIDTRPRAEFAAGHVPGSVDIEDGGSLLAYIGWLVPFNSPVALVTADETQAKSVTTDLFRIGYEDVRGYLPWGDWVASGRLSGQLQVVDAAAAKAMLEGEDVPVVDVRFESEQRERPLSRALARPVDQLHTWLPALEDRPVLVVCAGGQRAAMAASFMQREGKRVTALIDGGAEDLG